MINKVCYIDKYTCKIRRILLSLILIIFLNNLSTAASCNIPIPVGLEVTNSVQIGEEFNEAQINRWEFKDGNIIIWRPNIIDLPDDLECYAMLDKKNANFSLSLKGSKTSLENYTLPILQRLNGSLDQNDFGKTPDIYGLLHNVSSDIGVELLGQPNYILADPRIDNITVIYCYSEECYEIKAVSNISIPPFTISDLEPKKNIDLSSNEVEFSWRTELNSSSNVTIWENGNSTPIMVEGAFGVNHSVKADLNCNRSYRYEARSSICNMTVAKVGYFAIIECEPFFYETPYNFMVKRDYNQINCTLTITNPSSRSYNVTVNVINPYSDLITGFLETGTANESILLKPFEKIERKLIVHAQDAMRKKYEMVAELHDLDNGSKILDTAPVTINIDFCPNFNITEVDSDPRTLVKTIRIENLCDTLTDLNVTASPESRISLHPQLNHFNLLEGKSVEFYAVPLFSKDGEIIEGNITAIAGNLSKTLHVNFSCLDGKRIYKAKIDYPQFTFVKEDYYCTNDPVIDTPFLLPPGFNASDVLKAKMQIDFVPKGNYLPHNITISLNDKVLQKIVVKDDLKDTYGFDLSASYFNYALPEIGTPGHNVIRLYTEHLNPAHYIVSGKATISLCLQKLERWICASTQEEAEQILWDTPGISPVAEKLYVNIIMPLNNSIVAMNTPITIKAQVNGTIRGLPTTQKNLDVFAEIDNESRVNLFDDGNHNDSDRDDGVYGGEWTVRRFGCFNISVKSMNCIASGSSHVHVCANTSDLAVPKIDIVKSTENSDKVTVQATVKNLGPVVASSFEANLSIDDRENAAEALHENYILYPNQSMLLDWTLKEDEICGREIRVCVDALDNNTSNNCCNCSYCPECGKPPKGTDLIIRDLKNKTAWVGEQITIDFTAENIGEKDATGSFAVELLINGQRFEKPMDGLLTGQSNNSAFVLNPMNEGIYPMSICIDVNNTVEEINEGNNCAHGYFLNITTSPPRVVIITNTGQEVLNYPVSVRMPVVGSGNLRFVDEDGRELYYWVEEGSQADSNVTVWINATRIHAGENLVRVFLDTMPSDHQDPHKVFSFFDDFTALNSSQWIIPSWGPETRLNGPMIHEMGKIKLIKNSSIDPQKVFFQSRERFSSGQVAIFRADPGTGQDWVAKALGFVQNNDPWTSPPLTWVFDGKDIKYFCDSEGKTVESNYEPGYRIFEIRRQNNNIIFVINGTEYKSACTNSITSSMPIEFSIESDILNGSTDMTLDWVAVGDCRNGDLKAIYKETI